jgi:hypothetical protein
MEGAVSFVEEVAMKWSAPMQRSRFTATVHAADGVRFVAKAQCAEDITRQLAKYVVERCDSVQWPAVAQQVRSLVDDRRLQDAIDLYFEHVGERWDEEHLEVEGYVVGPVRSLPSNRTTPSGVEISTLHRICG